MTSRSQFTFQPDLNLPLTFNSPLTMFTLYTEKEKRQFFSIPLHIAMEDDALNRLDFSDDTRDDGSVMIKIQHEYEPYSIPLFMLYLCRHYPEYYDCFQIPATVHVARVFLDVWRLATFFSMRKLKKRCVRRVRERVFELERDRVERDAFLDIEYKALIRRVMKSRHWEWMRNLIADVKQQYAAMRVEEWRRWQGISTGYEEEEAEECSSCDTLSSVSGSFSEDGEG